VTEKQLQAAEEKPLKDEFIVCFARGYPDPVRCWPNTLDYARDFQGRHGGVIKHRIVSEWEEVT
jgi:hypothetical protein